MNDRPNIIFLISDQLRHDMLPTGGNSACIAPNIERLAETGTYFENCYATNPVCLPSRTSMITGKYCHEHHCQINQQVMARDEVCFPALLRDSGYFTAAIGKLHLWEQWVRPCKADVGFNLRNTIEGKYSLNSRVEESRLYFDYLADRGLELPHRFPKVDGDYERKLHARVSEYEDRDYIDTFLTTRAIRVIEDAFRGPFMLQLGLCSPHEFYDPPAEYLAMYDGVEIPGPVFSARSVARKSPSFRKFQREVTEKCSLPTDEWDDAAIERIKTMRRHYLATVTCVDRQVGRLIDALKKKGIYENTAIVFVADHGEFTGDHGAVDKNLFMYECNLHVPLIVHAPFLGTGGTRVGGLVQNLDVFSTVLEMAGVDVPANVSSRSLVPMLNDAGARGRTAVFAETFGRIMVRKGDFKLIRDAEYAELYDLARDPMEQENLAVGADGRKTARPEILRIVSELENEIVEWFVRTEAAGAVKNDRWREYVPGEYARISAGGGDFART